MEEARIQRLEQSFNLIAPRGPELVDRFYAHLFSKHPEVALCARFVKYLFNCCFKKSYFLYSRCLNGLVVQVILLFKVYNLF